MYQLFNVDFSLFRINSDPFYSPGSLSSNPQQVLDLVEWSPAQSAQLAAFYSAAPISMQCQAGTGDPVGGRSRSWDGIQQPQIEVGFCAYSSS